MSTKTAKISGPTVLRVGQDVKQETWRTAECMQNGTVIWKISLVAPVASNNTLTNIFNAAPDCSYLFKQNRNILILIVYIYLPVCSFHGYVWRSEDILRELVFSCTYVCAKY